MAKIVKQIAHKCQDILIGIFNKWSVLYRNAYKVSLGKTKVKKLHPVCLDFHRHLDSEQELVCLAMPIMVNKYLILSSGKGMSIN